MLLGVRTCAAAVIGLGLVAGLGCHSGGGYQLSWSFGDGQPASALTCADHGVFSVRITGASSGSGDEVEVPCAPGTVNRSVANGTWTFTVTGLDGQGRYRGAKLPTVDGGIDGGAGDAAASDAEAGNEAEAGVDAADAADALAMADADTDASPPGDGGVDGPADSDADADAQADALAEVGTGADADPLAATADVVTVFLQATWGPVEIASGKTTVGAVVLPPLPTCADGVDNNADGRVDLDDPSCKGDPAGSEASPDGGASAGNP